MDKKTLYVHIGMAKTGTSALQSFLWKNRELLGKKGYCYPSMRIAYSDFANAPEKRNGHFLVNDPGSRKEVDQKMYRVGMDEVVRLFRIYDHVVLSSESIWASTYERRAKLWEELKEDGAAHGFQVKIIIYLRRQDQYMMSYYRQRVKRQHNEAGRQTWKDFIANVEKTRQLDYYEKLGRIRDVLGTEAMIVCRYDPSGFYEGSIYADFLHRIGLAYTDEYVIGNQEENKSLVGNAVEMKRMINAAKDFNRDDDLAIRKILLEVCESSPKEVGTELFSKDEAGEFMKEYEQSNKMVAQVYFGDDKALFDHSIKDQQTYDPNNPYMMEDILRFSAIGLKHARREREEMKKQIEELQKQMEQKQDKLHYSFRTAFSKIKK